MMSSTRYISNTSLYCISALKSGVTGPKMLAQAVMLLACIWEVPTALSEVRPSRGITAPPV